MGAHNRDYMRDPPADPGGMEGAPWTLGVGALLVPLWLVYAVAHVQARRGFEGPDGLAAAIAELFLLDPTEVGEGRRLWTVFTSQLLHTPDSLRHILITIALLWQAGREVEVYRGAGTLRRSLGLGLVLTPAVFLATALAGVTTPAPWIGFDGPLLVLLGVLAVSPPRPQIRLLALVDVPTRTFALVAAGVVVGLGATAGGHGAAATAACLACLGVGALVTWLVDTPVPGDVLPARTETIVPDALPDDPVEAVTTPDVAADDPADERKRLDALLDKIHVVGIGALEPEERAFLDEASKRMRGDGDAG